MTIAVGNLLSTDAVFKQQTSISAGMSVTNNTTPAQITGLAVNLIAGHTYYFRAFFIALATSTPGLKVGVDGSCVASMLQAYLWVSGITIQLTDNFTALGQSLGGNPSGTFHTVIVEGTITASADGTFYITFAQNTSSGTAVVVSSGTILTCVDLT